MVICGTAWDLPLKCLWCLFIHGYLMLMDKTTYDWFGDIVTVLLKMGTYGFIRFSLPLFPDATVYFVIPMAILALIAIIYIYGSLSPKKI